MSEWDDLEEFSDQCRFGVNEPKRGLTKEQRAGLARMRQRSSQASRSLAKQQQRSIDRRHVDMDLPTLAVTPNQE